MESSTRPSGRKVQSQEGTLAGVRQVLMVLILG